MEKNAHYWGCLRLRSAMGNNVVDLAGKPRPHSPPPVSDFWFAQVDLRLGRLPQLRTSPLHEREQDGDGQPVPHGKLCPACGAAQDTAHHLALCTVLGSDERVTAAWAKAEAAFQPAPAGQYGALEIVEHWHAGVTVGNDITERSWQGTDLQWLRAKASDGFGPIGNTIVRGIDYNNVQLTTRVNGKVVQQENTSFMIHKPTKVISYLSHYFTLKPGDLVFMGTPGRTYALSDKDQVSVTIEGVGTVVNEVRF